MQGTAKEKKSESVSRSASFHLTVCAGHEREGLTQIITGFNGRNSRKPQCATEPVMKEVQQAVVGELRVITSFNIPFLAPLIKKPEQEAGLLLCFAKVSTEWPAACECASQP